MYIPKRKPIHTIFRGVSAVRVFLCSTALPGLTRTYNYKCPCSSPCSPVKPPDQPKSASYKPVDCVSPLPVFCLPNTIDQALTSSLPHVDDIIINHYSLPWDYRIYQERKTLLFPKFGLAITKDVISTVFQ